MPSFPDILFEGDEPAEVSLHGPGQKYAVSASQQEFSTPGKPAAIMPMHRLPESYDTGKLVLIARDPKCLHVQWDLSEKKQRACNALSSTGHLAIRVYRQSVGGPVAAEAGVHPESRDWFVHVDLPGEAYVAQLGYRQSGGRWVSVATSETAVTPPAARSEQRQDVFAYVAPNVPLARMLTALPPASHVAPAISTSPAMAAPPVAVPAIFEAPLPDRLFAINAPQRETAAAFESGLPCPAWLESVSPCIPPGQIASAPALDWTPEQEQALSEFIQKSLVRHEWMGSAEIDSVIRGGEREVPPIGGPRPVAMETAPAWPEGLPSSPAPTGPAPQEGFWFDVNAELVVYGATESNATVTIGGRVIRLRPDGTFSYRFALPDGSYRLPMRAVSADGMDGRSAVMEFSRQTSYAGEVGAHPQDPALKTPEPENLPS